MNLVNSNPQSLESDHESLTQPLTVRYSLRVLVSSRFERLSKLQNLGKIYYTNLRADAVVYLLIKYLNYGKKLILIYTLIVRKLLVGYSLVGVLLIRIKEQLIYLIVLALLTNKLRVFLVRLIVKNKKHFSYNLILYLNKPLIMNQLFILLMVFIPLTILVVLMGGQRKEPKDYNLLLVDVTV